MSVLSKMSTAAIALAAGACLAGAIAIAYLLIKEEKLCEDRNDYALVHSSKDTVVEVAVPSHIIGGLIGRQGSNINSIQKQTNTKIKFKEAVIGEDVRIAIIRGNPVDVSVAEVAIKQYIVEQRKIVIFEMEIPSSACGAVIGNGGCNIRMITDTSQAMVAVDRASGGYTTMVTIKGTEEAIQLAKDLIMEQVMKSEMLQARRNNVAPQLSSSTRQNQLYLKAVDDKEVNAGFPRTEELMVTAQDGFVAVYVSAITSPSRFWVQSIGTRAIELDKLDEQMTEFYSETANSLEHVIVNQVKVGDLIAAPFAHDDSWYRARVVNVDYDEYDPSESEVVIDYLDYGERETIKMSALRQLKNDFITCLPFQAIECALANASPADGSTEWTPEAIEQFEKLTHKAQWKVIMMKVEGHSDNGVNQVTVIDTNGGMDVDIREVLVGQGLAIDKRSSVVSQ